MPVGALVRSRVWCRAVVLQYLEVPWGQRIREGRNPFREFINLELDLSQAWRRNLSEAVVQLDFRSSFARRNRMADEGLHFRDLSGYQEVFDWVVVMLDGMWKRMPSPQTPNPTLAWTSIGKIPLTMTSTSNRIFLRPSAPRRVS